MRFLMLRCLPLVVITQIWCVAAYRASADQPRQPISLLPMGNHDGMDDGARELAVFNRMSGTLQRCRLDPLTVVDEYPIAQRIAAACRLDSQTYLVVDDSAHELVVVRMADDVPRVAARLPVAKTPTQVIAVPGAQQAIVASSWARRLTMIDVTNPDAPTILRQIPLPFAPRHMVFHPDGMLFVADAFGGGLAAVDVQAGELLRSRELQATHNITGIALDDRAPRDTLHLTHQMLNDEQATTGPNVHWGDVMSNVVRTLDVAWFLSSRPEETTAASLYYLGYPDAAAGDPQGIAITSQRQFVVLLGGVDEVAISDHGLNHFARVPVGRRPQAMWLDAQSSRLYVANRFDDSVTCVDLTRRRTISTASLTRAPSELSLAEQGERLFYDARLSSDGWYSCHSCHTDGHSNGQRSDTFGDGYGGDPKRVPTLLGVAETRPWAWNGKMATLDSQIRKSIETTMRGEPPTEQQVQALAAYLHTLTPPPSPAEARDMHEHDAIARGEDLFTSLACTDCHQPPLYTSPTVHDVGLKDRGGLREFNPPSLRGVGHRDRLLHDSSARSIQEALTIHPAGHPLELNGAEWNDLSAFLQSL